MSTTKNNQKEEQNAASFDKKIRNQNLTEVREVSSEKKRLNESVVNNEEAYLITDNKIENFDDPRMESLLKISKSVGKIYVEGEQHYRGTGSILFHNQIATCFHVVRNDMLFVDNKGKIEFNGVMNSDQAPQISKVSETFKVDKTKDLAILKIQRNYFATQTLKISDEPLQKGQEIFIIGFPHRDEFSDPGSEVKFKDFYGYKVLTKGKILDVQDQGEFTHDCNTLKGMSGAPILDAVTLEVIGIHLRGKHHERNFGASISYLRQLKKSK